MKLSIADVEHVAALARLNFSREEKEELAEEMGAILDYVASLDALPLDGVQPLSHVLPVANVFREDEPGPLMSIEDVLANAPDKENRYFRVPAIIE
jgi:aspartyl-tRNA(Asn)/glutamyl-tRNA(Gln) amidotransferase subunit C